MVNVLLNLPRRAKETNKLLQRNETLEMANQHAHRQSSGERILIRKTFMVLFLVELGVPWFFCGDLTTQGAKP